MTHTLVISGRTAQAYNWWEAPARSGEPKLRHARDQEIIKRGVTELRAGEVFFHCDQSIPFDTTFEMKGDGRKFVIISSKGRLHVAKPY